MKQNQYARKKRQLKFLAKKLLRLLNNNWKDSSRQIKKLIQQINTLLQELKHVIALNDLKRILGAAAIYLSISFTNQVSAQSFAAPQVNPFGLESNHSSISPVFADLDGDGDMDLFVGAYSGTIQYYENTGSASNPQFAEAQTNPFGIDINSYFTSPALADLDGGGDTDMLVGGVSGDILLYFENTGSASNPQFAAPITNPFGLVSIDYYFPTPAFADLDDDGDMDLLVGENSGDMQYFENIGSTTNPQFALPLTNPFDLVSLDDYVTPAFADLDDDGDNDLLIGEYSGAIHYFENTGSASNPLFAAPQTDPFGLLISGDFDPSPAFADLDQDGDIDLLFGSYSGDFHYFKNNSTIGSTKFSQSFDLKLSPNPVKDVLWIESTENIESIEIFNVSGKISVAIESTTRQVALNNLTPGLYMVKVTNEKGYYALRKILKQ